MYAIRQDDLSSPGTRSLLALHLAGMLAGSPAGSVFALDLAGLRTPEVSVWSVWQDADVAGIGALRQFGRDGELKSMRTHPDHLRRGVATLLLEHLITEARKRGMRRLSLETGSGAAFEPALALYRKRGFVEGAPFDEYSPGPFHRFLHLPL